MLWAIEFLSALFWAVFESDLDSCLALERRNPSSYCMSPGSSLKPSLHQSSFFPGWFWRLSLSLCVLALPLPILFGSPCLIVGGGEEDMFFSALFFSGASEDKNVDLLVVLPLISQKRNQLGETKWLTRLSFWHHVLWTMASNFSIDMLIRIEACWPQA